QQAWGQSNVTLKTAAIPTDSGRFPMHTPTGSTIQMFYSQPAQQDWIDYSAFESDLVSQVILQMAHTGKQATGGNKLTAFFYGYVYELAGSFGGHSRLDRLLASPDVDIVCSPVSYYNNSNTSIPTGSAPGSAYPDRWYGGPAGSSAAVDSVTAHGKLWI